MKLVPLGDRVVLKQLVAEETTKSGIVLTGQAKEKPQEAEVIAVGPGGVVDGKEVKDVYKRQGLLGHSDADVLLHAIMDALLGAAALGDIGKHFPDTDSAYKGISSILLLEHVGRLLEAEGIKIGNIDATVIAQRPKLAPYIMNMRENIAKALNIDIQQINVKATTEEGLGFTGEGLGIASNAICLVEKEKRDHE